MGKLWVGWVGGSVGWVTCVDGEEGGLGQGGGGGEREEGGWEGSGQGAKVLHVFLFLLLVV